MHTNIETLERATLDAVAPAKMLEIPGWLVPLDSSTIGRAISAVPLRHHALEAGQLAEIEALYHAHGLRPQFRLPDLDACRPLHVELAKKGYTAHQTTLVQVRDSMDSPGAAARTEPDGNAKVIVSAQATAGWASVYTAPGFDVADGRNRVAALTRSRYVSYAHIEENGVCVASGTASNSQGWIGLHGLRTLPQARGRGLATRVMHALVNHALGTGPKPQYLQVEATNAAALHLYARLGFRTVWRYQYWKPPHRAAKA